MRRPERIPIILEVGDKYVEYFNNELKLRKKK